MIYASLGLNESDEKKYVGKDYSLKENKVIGKTGLNLLSITL